MRVLFVTGLGILNFVPLFEVSLDHDTFLSEVFQHKHIFQGHLEPPHHHNGVFPVLVIFTK